MHGRVEILNDFWSTQDSVKLVEPFVLDGHFFRGSIIVNAPPKDDLLFNVNIPISYPLTNDAISIRFYCRNASGQRHFNADGSVCFHTPKNVNFKSRLVDELSHLKEWIDKYYIQEIEDERYEYLIVQAKDRNTFLFTDIDVSFQKGLMGTFEGIEIADHSLSYNVDSRVFLVSRIDKAECKWSSSIKKTPTNIKGVFFFIENEPISKGRLNVISWLELGTYLSQASKEYLYKLKCSFPINHELFILIGYNIPKTKEIHWQALKVKTGEIPVYGKKIIRNNYEYELRDTEINWCNTMNSSYDRYFGRGALEKSFNNKKILLMGCGAVGSSLAKILVRGGVRHLTLIDNDTVEPGNICRSEFDLVDIKVNKTVSLTRKLWNISPFVDVKIENVIDKILMQPYLDKTRLFFEKYDFIFDCTSDNELAYFIDELGLNHPQILNISISNKAADLVCVVGGASIASDKAQLFAKLDQLDTHLFYEGTGCWSSTFEASYFDINCLLHLAVKRLNYQYLKSKQFHTFTISNNEPKLNLEVNDY